MRESIFISREPHSECEKTPIDVTRGKPRYFDMTIGIGVIRPDGIGFASDSETGFGEMKRYDLRKITLVRSGFAGIGSHIGVRFGIVQAGKTDFSSRCVEEIRRRVSSDKPETADQVRKIVEQCAAEVRRHANSINSGGQFSGVESHFELLLGTWDKFGPQLFTLDSLSCYAQHVSSRGFACIGTGRVLADFVLEGLPVETKQPLELLIAAIYAVEVAKGKANDWSGPFKRRY